MPRRSRLRRRAARSPGPRIESPARGTSTSARQPVRFARSVVVKTTTSLLERVINRGGTDDETVWLAGCPATDVCVRDGDGGSPRPSVGRGRRHQGVHPGFEDGRTWRDGSPTPATVATPASRAVDAFRMNLGQGSHLPDEGVRAFVTDLLYHGLELGGYRDLDRAMNELRKGPDSRA